MIEEKKYEKFLTLLMVFSVFLISTIWAMSVSGVGGPDEPMRYDIVRWLWEHPGQLPRGDAEELLNPIWGISYAFYPILAYMIAAVFVSVGGVLGIETEQLIYCARMADVLFITLSAWLVIKIAKRLFKDEKKWLFSSLVIYLPGYVFLGTYVNNDALALLSVTIILLAWVRYLDEGWTWKNCMLLAIGMGICFLSYYNAYGWILCSFLFFCITILFYMDIPLKERIRFLLQRGIAVAGITILLAGWWFARNFMIYDGDILARKACNICAELNAAPDYKPSVYATPQNMGWGLKGMILHYVPSWNHKWITMVLISFVGTFGMFDIFMNDTVSKIYLFVLILGAVGIFGSLQMFSIKEKKGIFNILMLAAMVIPAILLVQYSYCSDFQAQGRYIMPAIYPAMYFVTCGYGNWMNKFIKKEKQKKMICMIISLGWFVGLISTYIFTVIPGYMAR